jgi:DNA-damage-inducible protein J
MEKTKQAKSAMIRARVSPMLKSEVDIILEQLGLSTTAAITLFYNQIKLYQGLPFDVRIPNKETIEAMEAFDNKEDITSCDTIDDFRKSLNI